MWRSRRPSLQVSFVGVGVLVPLLDVPRPSAPLRALSFSLMQDPALAPLRLTGLERVAALDQDIPFLAAKGGLQVPPVGPAGSTSDHTPCPSSYHV
jgi:hypothetical protein